MLQKYINNIYLYLTLLFKCYQIFLVIFLLSIRKKNIVKDSKRAYTSVVLIPRASFHHIHHILEIKQSPFEVFFARGHNICIKIAPTISL